MISILAVTLTLVVVLAFVVPTRTGRALSAKLRQRQTARQTARRPWGPPPTFVCKVRPRGRTRWPRRRSQAVWIHDVLLVKSGRLFPHTTALPVRLPEDVIRDAPPGEISGLGPHPRVITLRLDDGPLVELAAGEADRTSLAGPFLAAAIPGLPAARVESTRMERSRRPPTDHRLGRPDPKERD